MFLNIKKLTFVLREGMRLAEVEHESVLQFYCSTVVEQSSKDQWIIDLRTIKGFKGKVIFGTSS